MLARAVILAIHAYRRWLSPLKGYSCPHNALHGNGSCSQFAISAIEERGLVDGWRALQVRFGECKAAAKTMAEKRRKQLEGVADGCADACVVDGAVSACAPPNVTPDCHAPDCGSIDCSPDCSF